MTCGISVHYGILPPVVRRDKVDVREKLLITPSLAHTSLANPISIKIF